MPQAEALVRILRFPSQLTVSRPNSERISDKDMFFQKMQTLFIKFAFKGDIGFDYAPAQPGTR